jgi:hypothetical protein
MLTCIEFRAVLLLLVSFFPSCHTTSAKGKSQVFPLSPRLSTFTFTFLLGYHLLFREADFKKEKMRSKETLSRPHKGLNTTDNNGGLTESFSTSTELQNIQAEIYNFYF